jgi:hypothetical protein
MAARNTKRHKKNFYSSSPLRPPILLFSQFFVFFVAILNDSSANLDPLIPRHVLLLNLSFPVRQNHFDIAILEFAESKVGNCFLSGSVALADSDFLLS